MRGGEIRCGSCWRVCRFYPQAIWHFANRKVARADVVGLPSGSTL